MKTLLPSELDDKVLQMIKAGCIVSCNIAIAVGTCFGKQSNLVKKMVEV